MILNALLLKENQMIQFTSTNSEIRLRNAEQFLGCKEERYFASGYKQIAYDLFNHHLSGDKLTASLNLELGDTGKIKNGKIINQHIGSIESSLIAIRSLELFLTAKFELTVDEISACNIKRIEFKSIRPTNCILHE